MLAFEVLKQLIVAILLVVMIVSVLSGKSTNITIPAVTITVTFYINVG